MATTPASSAGGGGDGSGAGVAAVGLPELAPLDGAGGAPDEPDGSEADDEEGRGADVGAGGDGGAAGRTSAGLSAALAKGRKPLNSETTLRL